MINVKDYTKDTYSHAPEEFKEYAYTIDQITKLNQGNESGCVVDGWKLGFERAYQAARAGKLDFQQNPRKASLYEKIERMGEVQERFDITVEQLRDIERHSQSSADMIHTAFRFGYFQGLRASENK